MKFYKLPLLFLFGLVLAGCGQPGPLYLPDKPVPVHVKPEVKPESDLLKHQ